MKDKKGNKPARILFYLGLLVAGSIAIAGLLSPELTIFGVTTDFAAIFVVVVGLVGFLLLKKPPRH